MNLIENAVWQVESNLRRPQSLEDFASICGVSSTYLTRAFASSTGHSLMRYARARRLSEAARILALGVPDILGLALDAGYGSHEAFTRAFREHFGVTPESVRDARSIANLSLMEPIMMDTNVVSLAAPDIVEGKPMLFAGLVQVFPPEQLGAIPSLWEKFNEQSGAIPDVVGKCAYGASLSYSEERGCEYMCAVEVSTFADVPREFDRRTIEAATYAKFRQAGHITLIRSTIGWIWNNWLPNSGYEPEEKPLIEFYPSEFDPVTGSGGFEIWIPVSRR